MAKKANGRKVGDAVREMLAAHPELERFGDNALPLLGLALYLHHDNIEELGTNALTDGADDKKVDFCHIDPATKSALIAQGYTAQQWGRQSAPANKATDLISAAGWLFSGELKAIPPKMRAVAEELRRAIGDGEITRLEFVYVHNCHEGQNVENELRTAARVAYDAIGRERVSVGHREIGLELLDNLCRSSESAILVTDEYTVPATGVIEEQGEAWKSIVATIPGEWLHMLHAEHGPRLFSANYRDFLGVRNSAKNINNGIKTTVQEAPGNFWTFNNGITALTNKIAKRRGKFHVTGLSIINGAQTTGSISECSQEEAANVRILCRFVECRDPDVLHNIIRYNNTQNAFRSSDQRSTDPVQKRLAAELAVHKIAYSHRRSASVSVKSAISAESVGPLLCAFHGNPQTAARRRNDIFDSDVTYSEVFPKACTGEHVLLVYCLGQAIDAVKLHLKQRVRDNLATTMELKNYEVLKYSTSKLYLMAILGAAAEEIVGQRLADRYTWRFRPEVVKPDLERLGFPCREVIEAIVPLVASSIGPDVYETVRDLGSFKARAEAVSAMIMATGEAMSQRFAPLRDKTTL